MSNGKGISKWKGKRRNEGGRTVKVGRIVGRGERKENRIIMYES